MKIRQATGKQLKQERFLFYYDENNKLQEKRHLKDEEQYFVSCFQGGSLLGDTTENLFIFKVTPALQYFLASFMR